MKTLFIVLIVCMSGIRMCAQELQEIKLNPPNKTRGSAMMQALSDRQSGRDFDTKELTLQDLSDLLWAANGINRPDGRRTAPSALNRQEIDIYAIRSDGAYFYDAETHSLKPVAKGDYRAAVAAQQDYVISAPVSLVMIADLEKLGDVTSEQARMTASIDAGIVSQNINLFCAAVGLVTVPRTSMNLDELREVLNLRESQLPVINNPVGYPPK
jgi:SagB-type dehydrogenase family enzyme